MKLKFLLFLLLPMYLILSCDSILSIDYSKWMQKDENAYQFRESIAKDVISKKHYFIGQSEEFLFQTLGHPDGWGFLKGENCIYRLNRTSNGERRLNHNRYLVFWYNAKGDIISLEIVKT